MRAETVRAGERFVPRLKNSRKWHSSAPDPRAAGSVADFSTTDGDGGIVRVLWGMDPIIRLILQSGLVKESEGEHENDSIQQERGRSGGTRWRNAMWRKADCGRLAAINADGILRHMMLGSIK